MSWVATPSRILPVLWAGSAGVPVVGVPLPLVSYGGTAMMILLMAFGMVQSAHVHRPR